MTEDMEISNVVSPVDMDGQCESVFYQRTFNLGNYENEKIGVVVKALPGQTYEQVLHTAMDAVMKDHKDYDDLREKAQELRNRLYDLEREKQALEREVARLTEEKAKLLTAIETGKVDHPEIVKAMQDAVLKVGDRVAAVGTLLQIDPNDKRSTYYIKSDHSGRESWAPEGALVRVIGIDAPEVPEPQEEEEETEDYEDEDEGEDA